jgi:hypothetical protein
MRYRGIKYYTTIIYFAGKLFFRGNKNICFVKYILHLNFTFELNYFDHTFKRTLNTV